MTAARNWLRRVNVLTAHRAALAFWLVPGLIASWLLRGSVPWVVFMSWYAIVVTHWAALRADRPNPKES